MSKFKKTLIVGVGGFGSQVVCNLYEKFNQNVHNDELKKRVKFLALDTNIADIAKVRLILPASNVVQTSSNKNITIAAFLEEIRKQSTVDSWFETRNDQLLSRKIQTGAGQIRMISRLALSHAIAEGKLDIIEKSINELQAIQNEDLDANASSDINVYIVSSVAGGTGAGCFIQVAKYIQDLLIHSKGIAAPTIFSYLALGNIFLNDPSVVLSEDQRNNISSNTYACLKEVNNILSYKMAINKKPLPFDYGHPKVTAFIEGGTPAIFDSVVLFDFDNTIGLNLGNVANYQTLMVDALLLDAFSPTGAESRSLEVNTIITSLRKSDNVANYVTMGLSKVVFPREHLLKIIASLRLTHNISTHWTAIDEKFATLEKNYKEKLLQGLASMEKPDRNAFFRDQVENEAKNGSGISKALFSAVYRMAHKIDPKTNETTDSKAQVFVESIITYIKKTFENDREISALVSDPTFDETFSATKEIELDKRLISDREVILDNLERRIKSWLSHSHEMVVNEITFEDIKAKDYYDGAAHKLNSYILAKDDKMHPLTARFFLYELRKILKGAYESLLATNNVDQEHITDYEKAYDIKDDGDDVGAIESALEAFEQYANKSNKMFSKIAKAFGKESDLNEFKLAYSKKSRGQRETLQNFAINRMQELVFKGILDYIDIIIENFEKLFDSLASLQWKLNKQIQHLKVQRLENPTAIELFRDEEGINYLYQSISKNDNIILSDDLSASIYSGIFEISYSLAQDKNLDASQKEVGILNMFEKVCIKAEIDRIKAIEGSFAHFNIVDALSEEAKLKKYDFKERLKEIHTHLIKNSEPFGSKSEALDMPSPINMWSINNKVLQQLKSNATELTEEGKALFESKNESAKNAKVSDAEYFSDLEICRFDSLYVLTLNNNFTSFLPAIKGAKHGVRAVNGKYFDAYNNRVALSIASSGLIPTPHLDKRWHYATALLNIGENAEDFTNKGLSAMFWGLVLGCLKLKASDGQESWHFVNVGSHNDVVLKNMDGKIATESLDKLLADAILPNSHIVENIFAVRNTQFSNDEEVYQNRKAKSGFKIDQLYTLTQIWKYVFPDYKKNFITTLLSKKYFNHNDAFLTIVCQETLNYFVHILGLNQTALDSCKKYLNDLLTEQKNTKENIARCITIVQAGYEHLQKA